MQPDTVLRLGRGGLLGLALFAAVFFIQRIEALQPIRTFPAVLPADPLAAELIPCQKLGFEAAGNESCEEAWAESSARFFTSPGAALER